MKKDIRLVLISAMLSAVLAGCGGVAAESTTAAATSAAESAESATEASAPEAVEKEESTEVTAAGISAGAAGNETITEAESTSAPEAVKKEEGTAESAQVIGGTDIAVEPDMAMTTVGTYEGESDFVDEDQALFTDENGIEFIAQLSEETALPEGGLVQGKSYRVSHSEMMTASLPGIYPEVYAISEAE